MQNEELLDYYEAYDSQFETQYYEADNEFFEVKAVC